MRQLKILQITNRIPWPLNDGGNIATYNVTRNLLDLTLLSLNTKKHFQDPKVLDKRLKVVAVPIDTTVTPLGVLKGLFSRMPYNIARFESEEFRDKIAQLLQNNEFDLILMEGIYLGIYLATIRRFSPVPVVLRSHNIEHQIWERLAVNESNLLKRFYLADLAKKIRAFELKVFQEFEGIITISELDEAWYREQGFGGKLKTISAGAEVSPAFPPQNWPEHSVCFLGSLEWQPNVQGLYWFIEKVWPTVIARFPDAQLHVGGKNPPKELESLSAPGLTFHGMVPDAAEFILSSQVFIVPLHSGSGIRLKILEAMALGKCIVTTPIGAEGIAARNGEHLFLAADEISFAECINQAFADRSLSLRLGENAWKIALENYDWRVLVSGFVQFFQELGGQPK